MGAAFSERQQRLLGLLTRSVVHVIIVTPDRVDGSRAARLQTPRNTIVRVRVAHEADVDMLLGAQNVHFNPLSPSQILGVLFLRKHGST